MQSITKIIMGMPITVQIPETVSRRDINKIFQFFREVDAKYSPYKPDSLVSKINSGELVAGNYPAELRRILRIAELAKRQYMGFFDVWHNGKFDPSGVVKGWAISRAAKLAKNLTDDFYIEAGGDIQTGGNGPSGDGWRIGIRNPFNRHENVAVITLRNQAIATSGTAIRGRHIYNPHGEIQDTVVSLSIIADDILDADILATAAFAMGRHGVGFVENSSRYGGLMIDRGRMMTKTSNWDRLGSVYELSK